jgi:transcriptional regulator with XRE-family HTH domain
MVAMRRPPDELQSLRSSEITPTQCRMARAAVALGVRDLATAAGVSTNTISRFERGETLHARTVAAVRTALESAGVEFIAENGGGPDPDNDLFLSSIKVLDLLIEAVSPKVHTGFGRDELYIDPQDISQPSHTALKDVSDAELLTNPPHVYRLAVFGVGRLARDGEGFGDV